MTIILDGSSLTVEKLVAIARYNEKVELAPEALERIKICRVMLEDKLAKKEIMYGTNTGIGEFSETMLNDQQVLEFQKYLVYNHAAGIGDPAPIEHVRAALAARGRDRLVTPWAAANPRLLARRDGAFRRQGSGNPLPRHGRLRRAPRVSVAVDRPRRRELFCRHTGILFHPSSRRDSQEIPRRPGIARERAPLSRSRRACPRSDRGVGCRKRSIRRRQ